MLNFCCFQWMDLSIKFIAYPLRKDDTMTRKPTTALHNRPTSGQTDISGQGPYTAEETMVLHAQARAAAHRLRQEAIDAFGSALLAQVRHPVAAGHALVHWAVELLRSHRSAKVIE
jgi:hypothetical protein